MALKDKLGSLSQQISAEKQVEVQIKENEELKPIRVRVKQLEKEKLDLEIIKNSLDFKNESNPKDNQGMKDYAKNTADQTAKTRGQLESIAAENSEALDKLGIKNIDELAANPDFSEEEEVVAYKQAINKQEDLVLSDTKLKNRLAKLGLEMNDENFSYENASQEIGKRLENLDKELMVEKLKTPEGRAEQIDQVAEDFSKNTENIFWAGSSIIDKEAQRRNGQEISRNSYYDFSLSQTRNYRGEAFRLEFIDDNKSKINDYYRLPILPKNFNEQVDKYGLDIAEAALKKTYAKKVEAAFMGPIDPLGQPLKMRAALEDVSPERRRNTEELLNSFEKKKAELLNVLEVKSQELEDKGLRFSPTHASNYGGDYKEIFKFSQESRLNRGVARLEGGLNGDIINALKSGKPVFPEFDLDKLTVLAEKRISELDQAIEVVKNIKDQNGIDSFLNDRKSSGYIGNFHKQSLDVYLENIKYHNPEDISYQEISTLTSRANNWQDAVAYLDKEIAQAEELKSKTHEKIDELTEYNVMMYKLSAKNKSRYPVINEVVSGNRDCRLQDLSDYVNGIKNRSEIASNMMAEIAGLKAKLNSQEEVNVSGITIVVKEKEKEYKRLSEEMTKKDKEIEAKKWELQKEENSEPWLGKDKWRNRVSALKVDLENLKQERLDLKSSYDQNVKEAFHYLNNEKIRWAGVVKETIEKYNASGKVGEVFSELEKKLMNIVDREVPEEVQRDFDKLSDLEERLQGKK